MIDDDEKADGRRQRRWPAVLAVTFVVASIAFWTYALWGKEKPPLGVMDDPAYGLAAEEICEPYLRAVRDLPPAQDATDAVTRAGVIDEANAILVDQLDELGLLPTTTAEDERRTTEWLDDWRTYLGDRQDYAAELKVDDRARLLETPKGGDHISQALRFFADINAMGSCAPPGDVA